VRALDLNPIVAPLLRVEALQAELDLRPSEAMAFTSVNGVLRTAALSSERTARIFAVGETTARAARLAGYADVRSANGDVAALVRLILEDPPRGGVLHPCAVETAGDLVGEIQRGGVQARKIAVYRTEVEERPPSPVSQSLCAGTLHGVLIHSPKAGRAAAAAFQGASTCLRRVVAVGLSFACVEPLQASGFKALLAAPSPQESALMDVLGRSMDAAP
jgi:uroporphyrinogen-III synthase